jgi:tRNA-dihydrouridine synthase B
MENASIQNCGVTSFWDGLPRPIVGLAPMDGVTDAAYRFITARHGRPDVCFTEFTSVDRIVLGHDPNLTDLLYGESERPVIAQLFGTDPELFYKAAHVVAELGFDGIDINMGCPSKTIASRGAGAGLIRTPELAIQILKRTREGVADWRAGRNLDRIGVPPTVIEAVRRQKRIRTELYDGKTADPSNREIPISVKTRLGYHRVAVEEWIDTLLSGSPAAISLHGRTLSQQYRGDADWEAIAKAARIVRGSRTILLGNGDIRSAATAVRRIRETGVDGVLLGRVTMGNPWIFATRDAIREAVLGGSAPPADPVVSVAEKFAVALEHAELYVRTRGEKSYRGIRKYLAAYCRGFDNASELRQKLVRIESYDDAESILRPVVCG